MQQLRNYLTREGWKKDLEETLSRENISKYKRLLDMDTFFHFGFPGAGFTVFGAGICYTSREQFASYPIAATLGYVLGGMFIIGGIGGIWLGYGSDPSEDEKKP